jgi:hypothetical protein
MVEVGIAEYFGMAEALGIIATMIVVLYFSRKQMQGLSVDIGDRDSQGFGRKNTRNYPDGS